jgi:hypothetical protein
MQKTKQTSTNFLVIAITAGAIIAAATTSLSAATPAFAKLNCTVTSSGSVCTGGQSDKSDGFTLRSAR